MGWKDLVSAVGDAAVKSAAAPMNAAYEIAQSGTVSDDTAESLIGGEVSDGIAEALTDATSSDDASEK